MLFSCGIGSWLVGVVFLRTNICPQSPCFCSNGRQFYRASEKHSELKGVSAESPSSAFSSGDVGISALSTRIHSIFLCTCIAESANLLNSILVISSPPQAASQVLQPGQGLALQPREGAK